MFPKETFCWRAATLATLDAFAGGFPMMLLMPFVLASRSPAGFVGWSRVGIVPWLTGPWIWVAVQGEALFSIDRSRPFPSSAAKRRKGTALRCLRAMQPQPPEAVPDAEAPAEEPPSRARIFAAAERVPTARAIAEEWLNRSV